MERPVLVVATGERPASSGSTPTGSNTTSNDEQMRQLTEDPGKMVTAKPRVLSALVILEGYDQFGIQVRSQAEGGGRFFLPWGAVLYVLPPDD